MEQVRITVIKTPENTETILNGHATVMDLMYMFASFSSAIYHSVNNFGIPGKEIIKLMADTVQHIPELEGIKDGK